MKNYTLPLIAITLVSFAIKGISATPSFETNQMVNESLQQQAVFANEDSSKSKNLGPIFDGAALEQVQE